MFFTSKHLWQTMQALRREENTTCVLITHDLREAVFLADRIVVLSGRPATVQRTFDVHLGAQRQLRDLYTPETTALLSSLRDEIEIAQNRRGNGESGDRPIE